MQLFVKFRYQTLYIAWAVLYVLTAALGLLFPSVDGGTKVALQIVTGVFFVPPWAILTKAQKDGQTKHTKLVRNLAFAWLGATVVLMCANMLSAGMSEAVGNALHVLLSVICAPLVCSQFYVMPLFLWGTLLMGAMSRPVQ